MPRGFYKRTEEHKEKLRNQLKEYIGSGEKNPFFGKKHTEEFKKLSSKNTKGKRFSTKSEFKKGTVPWNKGKNHLSHPSILSGINHPSYNPDSNRKVGRVIRKSAEYKYWHKKVLIRDDYTCQNCGIRGGRLEVDHIMPFAIFPDLVFEILNGQTLCRDCHKKTLTWGKRVFRTYENISSFLS
jgi:hypothetical protein